MVTLLLLWTVHHVNKQVVCAPSLEEEE
uniref:Uncharacterized protein n=1 Tax=Nelumbo nucifera TaxID=4432 RepID=A0A822ZZ94_NELNU|nr:TPA_asm: hypothetical protein HUJ06_017215 [Nelumbo nucifera]